MAKKTVISSDVKKLSLLLDEAFALIARNPSKAYTLGKQALDLSSYLLQQHLTPTIRFKVQKERISALLVIVQREFTKGDTVTARTNIENITNEAHQLGDNEVLGKCYMLWGSIVLQQGKQDESLLYQEKAKKYFVAAGRKDAEAQAAYNLALIYYRRGDIALAFETYTHVQNIAREFKYHHLEISANNGIGILYEQLNEYDKAIAQYQRGIDLARTYGIKTSEAQALNNISTALFHAQYYQQAYDALQLALAANQDLHNKHGESIVIGNIGGYYYQTNQYTKALQYYQHAYNMFKELDATEDMAQQEGNIGRTYIAMGNHRKAKTALLHSLKLAKQCTMPRLVIYALIGLLESSLKTKDWTAAEKYFTEGVALSKTIQTKTFIVNLLRYGSELYAQTGKYKRSLELQQQLFETYQKIHNEESAKRLELYGVQLHVQRAELERQLADMRAQQLQTELETKERELNSMALHLVEKQELIASLKRTIEESKKQFQTNTADGFQKVLTTLEREAEASSRDWNIFREQFERISHDFIARLASQYNNLTSTELKVCALLRLQLSSKDIAMILHITDRAIEKHRLNIRKKLQLSKTASLSSVLAGM
ncbi:MAG: tetratricopeptide repeat protein [Bacteriodetes bacterium]|nr:tetratricopeptide repeat protein [Bacteroidota bacterium]